VYLFHRKLDLALFDGLNDLNLEVIPVIKRFSPQKLKQAEQLFHVVLEVAHQYGITFRRPAIRGTYLDWSSDRRKVVPVNMQFTNKPSIHRPTMTYPVRHHRSLASKATAAFAAFVLLFLMF